MAERSRYTPSSFSGHETFPLRYTWLQKATDLAREDPQGFGRDDAMVKLGVGRNMVRSMRHWALCARVVEEDPTIRNNRGRFLRVAEFGERLFGNAGWDPYLEDPMTLWLLHWALATNEAGATTWYFAFNHLHLPEFSKADLLDAIKLWASQRDMRISTPGTLRRDVDCLLRTYVPGATGRGMSVEDSLDCPLTSLGLIQPGTSGNEFAFARGQHETLPDELIAASIAHWFAAQGRERGTISLADLAFAPQLPGRVFCLSEEALLIRCERLQEVTDSGLVFDQTAGMRQIIVKSALDIWDLLGGYYARASDPLCEGALT